MKNRLKKINRCVAMLLLVVLLTANMGSLTVLAADNMTPTYEVKFMLDSDEILNNSHLLKKEYKKLFDTGSDYETIGILYLDTKSMDFNSQGWINRIRIKEGESNFELTYKKRYSIQKGDIQSALILANKEGFDVTDTNYEAEVDWGYSKMTLSLSCKKEKSNKGYDDLELPKKSAAIDMIKDKMPGKEKDWLYGNWGKKIIDDAKKAGPVYCCKYKGDFEGTKISVEIVPIENQSAGATSYITEISFKADTYAEASSTRADLMNYLEKLGILEHRDSLKTQMVLDAYLNNQNFPQQ